VTAVVVCQSGIRGCKRITLASVPNEQAENGIKRKRKDPHGGVGRGTVGTNRIHNPPGDSLGGWGKHKGGGLSTGKTKE